MKSIQIGSSSASIMPDMSHAMLEHRGFRHPFLLGTHFLGGVGDNPMTIVELAMCQCSALLRSRKNWWKDGQDEQVRQIWRDQALGSRWTVLTPSGHEETNLSQRQVDYIIDELSGYAALVDEEHSQVSCFERIWESDSILDSATLANLNSELSRLRKAHSMTHDDGTTLTLIDPFLHCLVYGRTLVYDPRHPGVLRPQPTPSHLSIYFVSQNFAFLPTDFSISTLGHVRFLSYINNLNPKDKSLYRCMERLLEDCVPLFSHVLTDLHRNNPHPRRIQGHCRYTEWDEPEPPEHSDDEDGWSVYERDVRHWVMHRPIELPDVPPGGYQGGLENRKYNVDLHGRTLQVVIQVSEIRLGPDNPVYPGSPWHVEGMKNERIVACAFYYSSVENVTENIIQFRMAVASPKGFQAGDTGATTRTWGMKDGDPCHQYIGSKPTSTGLAIAFPNIYQHRHPPFRLDNPSKEGHQRLVAFYLVDPEVQPVISTSQVPPQQKCWIKAAVEESIDARLPVELVEKIADHVEGKMSREEAISVRQEMLEERENFWRQNDNYHFCIPFDIWNELY